jgi:hypothetical protein
MRFLTIKRDEKMKNNEENNPFLAVPNDIMNTKHILHSELINFDRNIELKVFITVLATATKIFKANKKNGKQTFSTIGLLGDDSVLPGSLKLAQFKKIINDMNSPFFEHLVFENKQIEFQLSDTYIRSTLKRGFSKVDLMTLKSLQDVKTTKLAILTMICPSSKTKDNNKKYLNLNYLLKILDVSKNMDRTDQIRAIKNPFKTLEKLNLLTWKYIYPKKKSDKKLPEHYKFHFEEISLKTVEEVGTEEIEVEEYNIEYFDKEDDQKDEIEHDYLRFYAEKIEAKKNKKGRS